MSDPHTHTCSPYVCLFPEEMASPFDIPYFSMHRPSFTLFCKISETDLSLSFLFLVCGISPCHCFTAIRIPRPLTLRRRWNGQAPSEPVLLLVQIGLYSELLCVLLLLAICAIGICTATFTTCNDFGLQWIFFL